MNYRREMHNVINEIKGKEGTVLTYQTITPQEAKDIMETQKGCAVVDVRNPSEYEAGHIEGAICIPNSGIMTEDIPQLPEKDQEILVYCQSGARSNMAAKKLALMGYTNVKNFGGIINWPYTLVK